MLTDQIKELEATKAKLAALETEVASQLNAELAQLPARYGFDSVNAFVAAVDAAAGKRRGRKPGSTTVVPTTAKKRRKRAKITDEMRAEVKTLVQAGKTGAEIAKAVKISLPSVQNIKKALGLTAKR